METDNISELRPQDGDLVVVPEGTKIPDNLGFMVYSMKYLFKPSIIRSRGYGMGLLAMIKQSSLAQFFDLSGVAGEESAARNIQEEDIATFKTAQTQEVKAMEFGKELPMFFRYVRSTETLEKSDGIQEVIAPRGGVTFLIELDAPHKTLAFSYALCHSSDNFCRKAARSICLNRLKHGDWYEIKDVDPSIGVVENIASALADMLYSKKPSYVKKNGATFSSVSDRMNEYELEQLLKRIS